MKYALYPNKLEKGNKNSFIAKVQTEGSVELDEIIQRMCERGSGITSSEAIGSITKFFEVIEDVLQEGNTVNIPLIKIKPAIKGVFENADERFNNSKHNVAFNVSQGKLLKELSRKVKLRRINPSYKQPVVTGLIDKATSCSASSFRPSSVVEIKGNNFAFPAGDTKAGVYLKTNKKEEKIELLTKPGSNSLLVMLPDELPLNFRLKVIVRYQHHKEYKSFVTRILFRTNKG